MLKTQHRSKTLRSPEQWQDLINQHANSNLNVKDFCKQNGLATSNFYNWRKRLGADTITPNLFAEVEAEADPVNTWRIELTLAPGVVLRIA